MSFNPSSITKDSIGDTVAALINANARRATFYQSPKAVITATRRFKPYKRANSIDICLKIGKPNYRERQFIKMCLKAREPFPVRKVQLKFWTDARKAPR
jgi:hypothetical protein